MSLEKSETSFPSTPPHSQRPSPPPYHLYTSTLAQRGKMMTAKRSETRPPATMPEILIRATMSAPAYACQVGSKAEGGASPVQS